MSQSTNAPSARDPVTPIRQFTIASAGYDCFVSYSRRDAAAYARELWERLEARGLTVCLDHTDLDPGSPLTDSLRACVRRAPHFIFIDTPLARQSIFVTQEIEEAVDSGRGLVRICFDPPFDPAGVWRIGPHVLRALEKAINQPEGRDRLAPSKGPSAATVDAIVRRERRRLVRHRFWQLVAVVAAVIIAWGATTLLSWLAHGAADSAIEAFHDSTTPLETARTQANELLLSSRVPVYELFARSDYMFLRNLTTTLFKAGGPAPADLLPNQGPCVIAPAPPGALPGATCRWEARALGLRVYERPLRLSTELAVWSQADNRWLLTQPDVAASGPQWPVVSQFGHVAISRDFLAMAGTTDLRIARWRERLEDAVEILAFTETAAFIEDLHFSLDGRLLWVLAYQGAQRTRTLSLLDAATGHVLQATDLAGGDPGPCTPGAGVIATREHTLVVCWKSGRRSVFSTLTPPAYEVYSRGNSLVAAAALGPGGSMAFAGPDQRVVVCSTPATCGEPFDPPTDQPKGLIDGLTLAMAPGGTSWHLTVSRGQQASRCTAARRSDDAPIGPWRCASSAIVADHGSPDEMQLSGFAGRQPAATDGAGVTFRSCGGERVIPPTQFSPPLTKGARTSVSTSAASSCLGRAAVGVTGPDGSLVYVERRGWFPWSRSEWVGTRTFGPTRAVAFADDGKVELLEQWHDSLVRRILSPRAPAMVHR